MKKAIKIILKILIVTLLTIITQIGGLAFLLSEWFAKKNKVAHRFKRLGTAFVIYLILTFLIVPLIAPLGGREKIKHTQRIGPTTFMTVLLNRNYVRPALNELLEKVEQNLSGTKVRINYLDANFPFINKFPLLPHLSHSDGKKLDLSLIYESNTGEISNKQKSISGYGVFENPKVGESDQINHCVNKGYWQYDFPKYLTFGKKNKELIFSKKGTKTLMLAILKEDALGKIFIEPHLKARLNLTHTKIRYHGCQAVRHDDHIHLQLR